MTHFPLVEQPCIIINLNSLEQICFFFPSSSSYSPQLPSFSPDKQLNLFKQHNIKQPIVLKKRWKRIQCADHMHNLLLS